MEIKNGNIEGLKIIRLGKKDDDRGFLIERFHAARFAAAGLPAFVQDNHSRSAPRVLRGLHYQYDPPMGKLVGVTRGRIWDVAVDIRPDSPTCGQHQAIELSDDDATLFWIPAGFAHGFCVLGDEPADVVYKLSASYNPHGEGGIRFDDPELHIDWPITDPHLSDRDKKQQSWSDYRRNTPAWGHA